MRIIVLTLLALELAGAASGVFSGDSRRGAEFFASQGCGNCHAVRGVGARSAPDLGIRTGRSYTPTLMAGLFWNHAPAMWSAMSTQGVRRPDIGREQAADLFAYFYSVRYFDAPGDAARGKRLFEVKHCAECHGVSSVVRWKSLEDPIVLVEQMWNHAGQMKAAFKERKIPWAVLTSRELTDIFVYLQNLPQTRTIVGEFVIPSPASGAALFRERNCAVCHQGRLSLEERMAGRTLIDVATGMWNHAPKMVQLPPPLQPEEMRSIVSYVWATQFLSASGNATRGKGVFAQKGCAACHNDASSGAPKLASSVDPLDLVAALWRHGPAMLEKMKARNLSWPRFRGEEMNDLTAYLNTRK